MTARKPPRWRWRARQDRHLHAVPGPEDTEAQDEAFLAQLGWRLQAVPSLDYGSQDGPPMEDTP